MTDIVYRFIEFNSNEFEKIFDHLGNKVKSMIQKDNVDDKEILLNYPVVYIHTWKEKENLFVYVGETIDLIRRTNDHSDNNNLKSWQHKWKSGSHHRSVYFSCKSMNKSLALDLEDSLIAVFQEIEKKGVQKLQIVNKRDNRQSGYSNKNLRNEILKKIWNIIKECIGISLEYEKAIKDVDLSTGKSSDSILNPLSDDLQICKWTFDAKNEKYIEFFSKIKEKSLRNIPLYICMSGRMKMGKCILIPARLMI